VIARSTINRGIAELKAGSNELACAAARRWPQDPPLGRRSGCQGWRQSSAPPSGLARTRQKRKSPRRFGVHLENPTPEGG